MNRMFLALTAGLSLSAPALASITVLDFENIAPYPTGTDVAINEYYNGGVAGNGKSGPDYGVEFLGSGVLSCLNTLGTECGGGSWGITDPSQWYGFIWRSSTNTPIINVAAGFDTGFSFLYSAPIEAGNVISIYDDLNGGGNLLASLILSEKTPRGDCDTAFSQYTNYCPFVAAGVTFVGTAKSVTFSGRANYSVYDNVTLGSAIPAPEPATWTMLVIGAGLAAGKRRRR